MRCLRKILNKTKRDRIRNVAIGSTLIETPITHPYHTGTTQRWFGHVLRILISRIPKTLKKVKVEGKSRIDGYIYSLKEKLGPYSPFLHRKSRRQQNNKFSISKINFALSTFPLTKSYQLTTVQNTVCNILPISGKFQKIYGFNILRAILSPLDKYSVQIGVSVV